MILNPLLQAVYGTAFLAYLIYITSQALIFPSKKAGSVSPGIPFHCRYLRMSTNNLVNHRPDKMDIRVQ
jgi:hypothetical protein